MTNFEIIMPKMGESVIEATIIRWLKKEGEIIKEDDPICEIATDKVDSEIPSPVEGVLKKILFAENDVVPVGTAIAIIDMGGEDAEEPVADKPEKPAEKEEVVTETTAQPVGTPALSVDEQVTSTRFYSPLVKSIAKEEKISIAELETIPGSGKNGRLTKDDLLQYIKNRQQPVVQPPAVSKLEAPKLLLLRLQFEVSLNESYETSDYRSHGAVSSYFSSCNFLY